MSTPNFSPLSDDLWGSSFNTPRAAAPVMQQPQQQMMMSAGAPQPMPMPMQQQGSAPIPPSRTQAELQHLRQIVYQMAAKMQESKSGDGGGSGGGDNANLLKWIVILLGVLVFLFLIKLFIYWRRGKSFSAMSSSSPLYSSPGYSPGSATFSPSPY